MLLNVMELQTTRYVLDKLVLDILQQHLLLHFAQPVQGNIDPNWHGVLTMSIVWFVLLLMDKEIAVASELELLILRTHSLYTLS